jgi:opacity protein-like surface antigen
MRFMLLVLFLVAALAANASADDIAGSWQVIFVRGIAWQTIGGADFDFKVEGNKLSGTAHIGVGWPGIAPISEGTIDSDRISFLSPWPAALLRRISRDAIRGNGPRRRTTTHNDAVLFRY